MRIGTSEYGAVHQSRVVRLSTALLRALPEMEARDWHDSPLSVQPRTAELFRAVQSTAARMTSAELSCVTFRGWRDQAPEHRRP
jgi:hypothetical protein